jgi:GntR family transcriptional regulator
MIHLRLVSPLIRLVGISGGPVAEPLYRMIAEDLRRKIESGELPKEPRGPLPTEAELQKEFGASRNTIRDAIKWLVTLGLVETRPGQGTFVVEKPVPFVTTLTGDLGADYSGGETPIYTAEVAASGRTPVSSVPKVEMQQATGPVARALRLDPGAQVVSRHQQRFLDDTPWSLQTTFYPMSLVEQGATRLILPTDIEEGAVAYLARECDLKQVGYRDTVAVRPPEQDEAWFFKLPADGRISVFDIRRVGFDENGNRIRLTVTVYPADRNRFRINVGAVPPRGSTADTTPEADT